jgi:hypothetical protein
MSGAEFDRALANLQRGACIQCETKLPLLGLGPHQPQPCPRCKLEAFVAPCNSRILGRDAFGPWRILLITSPKPNRYDELVRRHEIDEEAWRRHRARMRMRLAL